MSGSTISSHVTISVTVGSPGYYSPLTILPVTLSGGPPNPPTVTGGMINPTAGVGVYSDLLNATILNQGAIYGAFAPHNSAGTAANGVDLFGGGTLTNQGRISGGGASTGATGVSIASSTLFNDNSASIEGGQSDGTALVATASYISNAGDIEGGFGSVNTFGIGVILTASTLINTGSISGGAPGLGGVRLYAASTLVNSGRIVGAETAWAVYVASGSVTNAAGGTVAPEQYSGQGVDLIGGATLDNQGFIGLPGNYSIVGSAGGTGVLLAAGAVLTNTGTIGGIGSATTLAGGTGVVVGDDSFTNAGTITGGAGDGAAFGSAGFGTIAGHGGAGVSVNGGSVTNAGSIIGGEAEGATGATDGPGVLVIAGSLTNSANITGGGNPYAVGPLGGAGVYLQTGAVTNDGTVTGGNQDGAPGAGAEISGGSFTNNAALSGNDGIDIVAGGAGGIFVDNTGTVAGFGAAGVSIATAASVVNSGTITGPTIAVAISAVVSFTNAAGGTLVGGAPGVTAAAYGVTASAAATVVNLGKIKIGYFLGTGVQLGAGGTVVNGSPTDTAASVAGATDGFGIVVAGGSLVNYGVVTTGGFSPTVQTAGVLLTSSSGTNHGTIVGGGGSGGHGAVDSGSGTPGYTGGAGVLLTNSTLSNAGTLVGGIGGEGGYGVYGTAQSAPGGTGGLGVVVDAGSTLVNTGTLVGGAGGAGGNHGINSDEIPNSPNGPGGGGASVTAGLLSNAGTAVGAASTGGGVSGGYGVTISGGTLLNSGRVAGGAGTQGSEGALGGTVYVGGVGGTGLVQTGGTVSNTGTIVGGGATADVAGGAGVRLTGGSFTNLALVEGANSEPGGVYSYSGGTGLYLSGVTATNAGTIAGGALGTGTLANGATAGAAVAFGSAAATLIVDPGALFSGDVRGNGAVSDALVLGAGHGPGSLDMGGSFSGLSVLAFDPGSEWTLSGGLGPLASGQAIDGFTYFDTIVLEGVVETGHSFVSGTGLELSGATNATLGIVGAFSTTSFHVGTIGGNTEISIACYVAGTRIATPRGQVPVEHLRAGDLVLNSAGEAVPVRWLGHRRIDCRRHPDPASVWPVRVRADAFAAGLPERDLRLSADHAVYVDGVLIPIKHLINGTTVTRVPVDAVTYYHVELPCHDVILAEGLAAESYLDTAGRAQFANGGEVVGLFPDFAARGLDIALLWEACGFAPLVVSGPIVDRVRARLRRRAAASPPDAHHLPVPRLLRSA